MLGNAIPTLEEMKRLREQARARRDEYESTYGISLSDDEIAELLVMEEENKQCLSCGGYPCAKENNIGTVRKAIVKFGRLYFTETPCAYAQAAALTSLCIAAGVPRRYASKTLTNYEAETTTAKNTLGMAQWYIMEKPLRSLYLYGGCGTGKTLLTSIMTRELIKRGSDVMFTDMPTLLDELKESFDAKERNAEEIMRRYRETEYLVLDDLGVGMLNAWRLGIIGQLINARYNDERRLIVTSNLDYEGLEEWLGREDGLTGRRIVSRLREMSEPIYTGETDWRIGQ